MVKNVYPHDIVIFLKNNDETILKSGIATKSPEIRRSEPATCLRVGKPHTILPPIFLDCGQRYGWTTILRGVVAARVYFMVR